MSYAGGDPAGSGLPEEDTGLAERLRQELGYRTRSLDRCRSDFRALEAEVVAGLSTAVHAMVMHGGLPACRCGLSLCGGRATEAFITHALAVVRANSTYDINYG